MNCPFGYVEADDLSEYSDIAEDDVAATTYEWNKIKSDIESGK